MRAKLQSPTASDPALGSPGNRDDRRPRCPVFQERSDRASTFRLFNGCRAIPPRLIEECFFSLNEVSFYGVATIIDSSSRYNCERVFDEYQESLMLGAIFSQRLRPSPHFALDRTIMSRDKDYNGNFVGWVDLNRQASAIRPVDRGVQIKLIEFRSVPVT